jgi:tungstate transport system ATP-binding protein
LTPRGLDIVLEKVSKSYDGKEVLKGCSHVFEKGKLHALIGPNGSGKSTLLRICCLIDIPEKGEVGFTDGKDNYDHNLLLKRRVSLVFSKGGLFNTSVYKNVSYGLKIRGIGFGRRRALSEEVLRKVGLWNRRKQNAKTLSAGEAQRLSIARVLVIDPDVFLLDEPTASLDPANTVIIEDIIRSLMKDRSKTVILATHNMFQAQRLSERIVFMHEGEMFDEGSTGDFFEAPRSEIAYKFITGKLIY